MSLYRRRNGYFRYTIRLKTCGGNYIRAGSDLEQMRLWLKEHARGNYRTLKVANQYDVRAHVLLDNTTDAAAFKLYWSEDIRGLSDRGYSTY